ncbi:hypothetical protein N8E89_12635 [Phyllobacterium sp. A18/5-2]|uniref:hypothetical protein n=1 Tax=Phyllobacterium sp. A18/5-2 TaxID=2978392 RepID=UPI0021C9AF47|nr:hypothetical protein [Phyllobacterium sp. A18/5-2]UXN63439.1 hypothetical protein N8E89_12635 [Phyllobacterium sp. A18/5-2]
MLQNNILEMTANDLAVAEFCGKQEKLVPIYSVTRSRIAESFGRLCRRWVNPSVAGAAQRDRDARMAGSILAMPVMLVVAMVTSHFMLGELAGIISLVVGVLALPMIFCGALSLSKDSTAVGMSALGAYGLSIASIGAAAAPANLLLWIMAAAIPLEAWFVYRSGKVASHFGSYSRCRAGRAAHRVTACGWQCGAVAADTTGLVLLSGDIGDKDRKRACRPRHGSAPR